MRCYGNSECYEDAIAAARRILVADPFRESVFRSMALLLVLNGQRGKALGQYERWRASFLTELGVDPMPQTVRLAEDIRSGKIFENIDTLKEQLFRRPEAAVPNQRSRA
jgi:DNA-binding SARP family transcriptional activator